jgi:aspartyl protease family protein
MNLNRGIWIALSLLGLAALVMLLQWQFPDALKSEDQYMRLVYLVVLLTLVCTGLAAGWQGNATAALKQAVAWIAIAFVLVIIYSYRDDLMGLGGHLGGRFVSEMVPTKAVQAEPGVAYLSRDMGGHFRADALVNGRHVRFMVDTGASDVALTMEDAQRLGIDISALRFTTPYQTANGIVYGARFKLDSVQVADITVRNVEASITQGAGMAESLLGMSFLGELASVEVKGEKLVLRQ